MLFVCDTGGMKKKEKRLFKQRAVSYRKLCVCGRCCHAFVSHAEKVVRERANWEHDERLKRILVQVLSTQSTIQYCCTVHFPNKNHAKKKKKVVQNVVHTVAPLPGRTLPYAALPRQCEAHGDEDDVLRVPTGGAIVRESRKDVQVRLEWGWRFGEGAINVAQFLLTNWL